MTMGYEEFKDMVRGIVCGELGMTARVEFRTVHHANGGKYEGMLIHTDGREIWPVLPVEHLYDRYGKGEIKVQEVMDIVREEARKLPKPVREFLHRDIHEENALKKIFVRLVSYDRNSEWLKGVPHQRFLDMAVIYYFKIIDDASGEHYIIHIGNGEMERSGLNCAMLERLAWENMEREQRPVITDFRDILESFAEERSDRTEEEPEMYILSSASMKLGAVYMMRTDLLGRVAEKIGDDLYLLPSSVDEVLLIPQKQSGCEELRQIVGFVNRYGLDERDFLSDEVYGYDRKKGEVYICKQADGT